MPCGPGLCNATLVRVDSPAAQADLPGSLLLQLIPVLALLLLGVLFRLLIILILCVLIEVALVVLVTLLVLLLVAARLELVCSAARRVTDELPTCRVSISGALWKACLVPTLQQCSS